MIRSHYLLLVFGAMLMSSLAGSGFADTVVFHGANGQQRAYLNVTVERDGGFLLLQWIVVDGTCVCLLSVDRLFHYNSCFAIPTSVAIQIVEPSASTSEMRLESKTELSLL